MKRTLLVSLFFSVGCRAVDPAPADLDSLFGWYWNAYPEADFPELREAIDNTVLVTGTPTIEEALRGSITRLGVDDLAAIGGLEGVDPALANGFYLVTSFACTAEGLERIYAHLAQDELYVGVYDAYNRVYTSDADAHFAREVDGVSWDVELQSSLLGTDYTEWLKGGLRFVPATETHGAAVLARTWMPTPAVFDGSNKTFDQDYQIELFYEYEPGQLLHLYGVWRRLEMSGLTSDDDAVVNIVTNNLIDWDNGTAQLCAEGRP